jgi:septal ring factor EnvC (AmiA/AmiB activator)
MAVAKGCSMCGKQAGSVHCTGCDGYFCWKDIKTHREGMFIEMDKIVEERNHLQDQLNNGAQLNSQQNPVIEQIDVWEKNIIAKVKQAAAKARQQAIELLNAKRMKINTEFESFTKELIRLKDSEDYVEHDLTRLNQMIGQFKQGLKDSTQPNKIVLHTEQSNGINWECLIFVEAQQAIVPRKLIADTFLQSTFRSRLFSNENCCS